MTTRILGGKGNRGRRSQKTSCRATTSRRPPTRYERSHTRKVNLCIIQVEEYISNGAVLGWLIEPFELQVFVYRPGQPIQQLDRPLSMDAGPELPGFVLDLAKIWEPEI